MLETAISNISKILENVADLLNKTIKYDAVRNRKIRRLINVRSTSCLFFIW